MGEMTITRIHQPATYSGVVRKVPPQILLIAEKECTCGGLIRTEVSIPDTLTDRLLDDVQKVLAREVERREECCG